MKSLILTSLACSLLLACETGSQQSRTTRDSLRVPQSPATKRIDPDSPATTTMPVLRTDTARQADMPVAMPPNNVQPK